MKPSTSRSSKSLISAVTSKNQNSAMKRLSARKVPISVEANDRDLR